MTTQATRLLNAIVTFYLKSRHFNGMALSDCAKSLGADFTTIKAAVRELVTKKLVTLNFSEMNPFIKVFNDPPIDDQLKALDALNEAKLVCAYPTVEAVGPALKTEEFIQRPFTKLLASGKSQLEAMFFDLSVLELYRHDPRYVFHFDSYSGWISIADEFYFTTDTSEGDKIYLKSFGIGYDDSDNRVLVAYLCDVAALSPEHQQYWKAKLLTRPCKMVREYYENTILGKWVTTVSIYAALLAEQEEINKLCRMIDRPNFFREEFRDVPPPDYSILFQPTRRNYDAFVLTLDKMLSENINKEFFLDDIPLKELIPGDDGTVEARPLGTLSLLQNWLKQHIKFSDLDGLERLMKPFRHVRQLRMQPAHKIVKDEYNKAFHQQQDELVAEVYLSLRSLRILLSGHPDVEAYTPPEYLETSRIRTF